MEEVGKDVMQELYQERESRIRDAINLKVPDRVPVVCKGINWYFTQMPDITAEDMFTDNEKFMKVQLKYQLDFQTDAVWRPVPQDPIATAFVEPCRMKFPWEIKGNENNPAPKIVSGEIMEEEGYQKIIENGYLETLMDLLPKIRPNIPDIQQKFLSRVGISNETEEVSPLEIGKNIEILKEFGFPTYFAVEFLSPFNCLTLLRSYQKMCLDLNRNPDLVKRALDKTIQELTDVIVEVSESSNLSRVNIGLHRESATFFSPEIFDEILFPEIERMVKKYKENGLKVILHCDSNWDPLLEFMKKLPKKSCVLQFDMDTDPFKASKILGDKQCIDAGPMEMEMARKSPKEIEKYCRRLIEKVGENGGFILKSEVSCDAKPGNIRTLVNTAKSYGVY